MAIAEMTMTPRLTPSLFDRLIDVCEDAPSASAGWGLEQLKDAVARDLEDLLNTRTAISPEMLAKYPDVRRSLINYGLIDFSAMCLTSEDDRNRICAAVKQAIAQHEPRLYGVSAGLRVKTGSESRVDFVISGMLKTVSSAEPVYFDAVLLASTHRYSVRKAGGQPALGSI
jgi:type VI secretion system protein ImpF